MTPKADHLCVLIHGLWGNPDHLAYIEKQLQAHVGDSLLTLVCKSNSGNFTYDGIDVGAERVTAEIKARLKELKAEGHELKKFSIVGYSLGGVVARYVIGLLDHEGLFEELEPVNFNTFATPHLGVRTPGVRWTSYVFNNFGPRLVSASGLQLFVMDKFRDTNKPLLEVLADPGSIFIHALAKFKHRVLYANIINDRLAHFFTTAISSTDPYQHLDKLKFKYLKGYEPILMDGSDPCELLSEEASKRTDEQLSLATTQASLGNAARTVAFVIVAPIFLTGFLGKSALESYRSQQRIRLHNADEKSGSFRIPLLLQRMASNMENRAADIVRLPSKVSANSMPSSDDTAKNSIDSSQTLDKDDDDDRKEEDPAQSGTDPFRQLNLLPSQFAMIKSLDQVGFQKYHVYFHNTNWTHAAIVVRRDTSMFDEGRLVVKHWVENTFKP